MNLNDLEEIKLHVNIMRFGSIDVYFVNKNNRCGKFGDHHSLVMAVIVQ